MTELEELQIIRRVVDGETEAFEHLVLQYEDRLLRMIATLLNDERRLAEDLAQTVFVEVYRRLKDFDPARSRFSTWLFMIARSRTINALKKKRPSLLADLPERATPAPDLSQRERLKTLDLALHQLPDKQKRAFTLVALENLSYAEVAQIETTTVGTIKSRVSRARAFLKASLSHY
ncbi:MAG: sigma-70 family RNA polymerase sigma factor [Akkermansiaceae bacterium]|nr:sigma-70 family RNA polymerase sigma factor [Akkermansiaceae bacterium]